MYIIMVSTSLSTLSSLHPMAESTGQKGDFPDATRQEYVLAVYANCITQMKALVLARAKLDIALEHPENEVCGAALHVHGA